MPILPTEMPYSALLPRGLENILIGGKAFSGTHDVLYNLRNQPDMENLGCAMGVAAAYAIRDGVSTRLVDLRNVQKRLTEVGTLLPGMLTRRIKDEPLDEVTIRAFVKQLDGRHLAAWEDVPMAEEGSPRYREKIPFVEICSSDPELAVPILERELAEATGDRRVRLAQALAMFGSRTAAPVLIEAIEQAMSGGNLPPKPVLNNEKDGGAVERTGIGIPTPPAALVYSLGMTRDRRALAVWEKLGSLVKPVPADFADELPWPFHYVDAICYGAELLGENIYWQYYQNNRWRFQNRTETVNFDNEDFQTWDLSRLISEIVTYSQLSLKESDKLKKICMEEFEDILVYGTTEHSYLRPTLYDLLAHQALSFFVNDEASVTQPVYKFELKSESDFSSSDDFVDINYTTKDSLSLKFYAIQLYQQLIAFHIEDKEKDALIDVDLARLNFVRSESVNSIPSLCARSSGRNPAWRCISAWKSRRNISCDR